MNIVNLTPHPVTFIISDGVTYTFDACDHPPRVKEILIVAESVTNVNGIPIYNKKFSAVEGIPPETPDTYYIVSTLVAQAMPNRLDLLVPNEFVRDDNGRIIGCKSLARLV